MRTSQGSQQGSMRSRSAYATLSENENGDTFFTPAIRADHRSGSAAAFSFVGRDHEDEEGGRHSALLGSDERPQGVPDMWSRPYLALYAHYASIGIVNGLILATIFPYCQYVKKGEPNTCQGLPTFVRLPWNFKFLYGAITDSVPLFGSQRKSYMCIGWGLTVAAAAVIGAFGDDLELSQFALLCVVIEGSFIVADVAADAVMVSLSKREPDETRGTLLSNAYTTRFAFTVLSALITAFCFNGPETQGSFSWGLSVGQLFMVAAALPAALMLPTLPFLRDETKPVRKPICRQFREFYDVLHQPAAARFGLASFLLASISLVVNNAAPNSYAKWFEMSALQNGIDNVTSNLLMALCIYYFRRNWLGISWRKGYATGTLLMQLLSLVYIVTVYCSWARNGWWIVFVDQDSELAYSITYFLGIVIVPEITTPGLEGITYGAMTTLHNCGNAVSNVISNNLLPIYNVTNDAIAADTSEVRWNLTKLTFITTGIGLSSLIFIPLVPDQKEDVQRMKTHLPRSKTLANLCMFCIVFGMFYGAAVSALAIFPGTSCLPIAGGSGCD